MAKRDDMPPETYKESWLSTILVLLGWLSLLALIPAFLLFGLMPAVAVFFIGIFSLVSSEAITALTDIRNELAAKRQDDNGN